MRINLLIITILSITILACNAQKSKKDMSKMDMEKTEKSQTIQLKKGELFLAVVGFQMAGKEALLQEYFGIVFPPAQKNGFAPLGQLPIDKVVAGKFMPNEFVGLFKWPSMENIQAFMGEVSPEKLAELRVKIWSELKQHMVMVPEDMSMTFSENKVYEVKMIWTDQMVNSNAISSNGGRILLNSPIAGYEDLGKNEAPNNILIIEWSDKKSAESFRKMKALKFRKEEAFYTHFTLPEKK